MPSNISVPGAVAIAILVVLVLIVIVRNIYIVQQSRAYVVERLGAFHSVWGVGFHLKVPFIERVVKKVSLKEQVADFDPQPVITKDNVTMQIDTVIYFQITDPKLYTYGVEYPMNAIENLTATTLRNIIGELELDQSLTSRDHINTKMRSILDEATDPWGIKVNRVELKNILPPREIQNAMEKQMKAERERRESILQAEGEKASKILVAEGEKQSAILRADAAKQAKIMAAEAEATSILKVQQAMADSMRMLNENAPNDQVIKLKALEALEKVADGITCDVPQVMIDEQAKTVYLADPEMSLDVGSVGKGYAVEMVAQAVEARGLKSALISVGGNVCATGPKTEAGDPWVVGIQDPDGGDYLHTVCVTGGSVVTSGDYQRTYLVDGESYHHIIDPETLMPSRYWRSVTVVCADSGIADALSTALFLTPQDEGQTLLTRYNAEAMWVDADGGEFFSPGFRALLRT